MAEQSTNTGNNGGAIDYRHVILFVYHCTVSKFVHLSGLRLITRLLNQRPPEALQCTIWGTEREAHSSQWRQDIAEDLRPRQNAAPFRVRYPLFDARSISVSSTFPPPSLRAPPLHSLTYFFNTRFSLLSAFLLAGFTSPNVYPTSALGTLCLFPPS